MIINGVLAAVVQILLAGVAYWAIGWDGQGAFAASFPENTMVQQLLALLISWLAGILCFLAGYWMSRTAAAEKSFLSAAGFTLLAAVIAVAAGGISFAAKVPESLFFPLKGLALPFVPLLLILGFAVHWPADSLLAILAPLLIFSGMQIRLGRQGKRALALGIIIGYLALLLLFPVAGLMLRMF